MDGGIDELETEVVQIERTDQNLARSSRVGWRRWPVNSGRERVGPEKGKVPGYVGRSLALRKHVGWHGLHSGHFIWIVCWCLQVCFPIHECHPPGRGVASWHGTPPLVRSSLRNCETTLPCNN